MKTKAAFLSVALLLGAPMMAGAQTSPAPPPLPAPSDGGRHFDMQLSPAQLTTMRKFHEQATALRKQSRAQIFGALTPAHRQFLATQIGQLAIADNPDAKGTAARIDATLSAGEKNRVIAAEQSYRSKMESLMTQLHQQMIAQLPADQQAQAQSRMSQMIARANQRPKRTPDAGRILLGAAYGFGPRMMAFGHMRGMHGPGGMRQGPGGPPMAAPDGTALPAPAPQATP